MSLDDLRSSGKSRSIAQARKVFSILARDKGYKSVEIGKYLDKDASKLTTYLRERDDEEEEEKKAGRLLEK